MYAAKSIVPLSDHSGELSFRRRTGWMPIVPGVLDYDALVMGDEPSGPMLAFIACEAAPFPPAPAHGHASDSLRLCICGHQLQGGKSYGPGEFRIQEGWVPYAAEGFGDDGMWGIIALADRRGARTRHADPTRDVTPSEMRFRTAQKERNRAFGIEIDDMLSDEPSHTAGPSAVATTLGPLGNSGKLDGSFADRSSWLSIGPSVQIVVALLGDAVTGPVFVFVATEPGAVAMPSCRFGTELARIVVAGGYDAGGTRLAPGDARVHAAGARCDAVVAGPEGLHELIVLADRRHAEAIALDGGRISWPAAIGTLVRNLTHELTSRSAPLRVRSLAPRPD